jgi:hypothetical protein
MGGKVQIALLFNILVLALATAYKFTSKKIAPLFVFHTLAGYGFLVAFTVLVKYNENQSIAKLGG